MVVGRAFEISPSDPIHLEATHMLNPQMSPHRSTASRPVRSAWHQSPSRTSHRTPDLLSQVRQIPPAYLGGAGLLVMLAGLLISSSWILVGLGLALMIAAGVISAARPRTRVMYWRGRRIELTEEPSARSPLRRWLGRR
jgi:hypothetical protein